MKEINVRDRRVRLRMYIRSWVMCAVLWTGFLWLSGYGMAGGILLFLAWTAVVFGVWEHSERRRDREYRDEGLT